MSIPGIPKGFEADEKTSLRTGSWRFYYIVESEDVPGPQERNLAVREGVPMEGIAGLGAFLDESGRSPELLSDPAGLAERAAFFVIQGDSRQSCLFQVVSDPSDYLDRFPAGADKLSPPKAAIQGDLLRISAWLYRDGYLQHLQVEARPHQLPTVDTSELLTR